MPLSKEDDYKITHNYVFLRENIEANHLAPFLYSKGVITMDDKGEIRQTIRRDMRADLLLEMLQKSSSKSSYSSFIDSLREDYGHIVEKLEETDLSGLTQAQSPYSWFEEVDDTINTRIVGDSIATLFAPCIGNDWEVLMYRLGISQVEVQRENKSGFSDTVKIIHLLIKWRQKVVKEATIGKLMTHLMQLEDSSSMTIDWDRLRKAILEDLNTL